MQSQSPGEAALTFSCREHTPPPTPSVRRPAAWLEAGRRAPGPRSPRVLTHVPATPAPLAPALAQIPAPVARPSPRRCCCGNSMAMSICHTASRGLATLARGAPGPPGARRRRRAAGAPAGPALPARRGRLRRATDLRREISRGKMASPEPEESWSNHIHTHTRPHAHTRTPRAAGLANFSRSPPAPPNYIYPSLSNQCYFFFLSFLQRMDWSLKKCCRVRARRRRRAEGEGAFAELCSSVRGAGRPSSPACPPAVASAAAAAAAAAPWPRPPRAPAASPRHPPASPASAGVGSGPSGCLPRPLPSPGVLVKGRGRARAGEGEDRSGSAAEPNGDSHPAICLGGGAGTHTARPTDRGPLPRLEPGEAQPVTGERPLPSPSCSEFL